MFVTLPLINPVLQSRNIKLKYFTITCVEKKEKEINKTKPLQSFLLENFTMIWSLFLPSRWQASILSPEIFTPIRCKILQTVGSSWSCLTEGMPTTPSVKFYWTQLLNKSIIHLLHYNDFQFKSFKATMYFFNFFCQGVYCVICLFLSLQEKFNDLCLIQRLQYFLNILQNEGIAAIKIKYFSHHYQVNQKYFHNSATLFWTHNKICNLLEFHDNVLFLLLI